MPMINKTTKIWEKFCCELKKFIQQRVKDDLLVDDIRQDVFIKIHKNINTLKDESKLRSWIYQITRNTIIDYSRKNKLFTDKFPEVDFFDNIKEENISDEIAESIKILINNLPEIYKEAITETEFNNLTQKALAEKLNISIAGAKSRVQRARQMIKDQLMNCCHYEFDKYGTIVNYYPATCCCC